jgi:putative transposase
MDPQTVRKTFTYYRKPTPEQERMLDRALMLCRRVYHAAIGERREPRQKCGVSVGYSQQKADLPGVKAELPEYGEVHSQVLQDGIQRVDRAFQAFFRRVKEGETLGYPRFHGGDRYNSLTYPQFGNGATLGHGFLVLSKIGRIAVRWSRPLEGALKTVTISREADGWCVRLFCADVPVQALPATGQETGIDLGVEAFATLSDGARIFHPGWYRQAERTLKTAQRRVLRRKKGSNRRRKAVTLLAKAHQRVRRQRQDFHHKTALAVVRANDIIYHANLQPANMVTHHHLTKSIPDAGWGGLPLHPDGQGSMRRSQDRRRQSRLQPRLYLPAM